MLEKQRYYGQFQDKIYLKTSFGLSRANVEPWLTVIQNLSIVCEDIGLQERWLSLFDLSEVSHLRPGQLSLGMQRRIAIARGILARPGLLMLDEPSASLTRQTWSD